jgi:hypothetical protein
MKAREYIEHQFLPWILFLDKNETIKQIKDRKEGYLLELYNHISKEFMALERYELFMFRTEFFTQMLPIGLSNIILIKTPEVLSSGDSAYLFIVHNDSHLIYYTVDLVSSGMYQIKKYYNKKVEVIANTSIDIREIMNEISEELFN